MNINGQIVGDMLTGKAIYSANERGVKVPDFNAMGQKYGTTAQIVEKAYNLANGRFPVRYCFKTQKWVKVAN